MKALAAIELNRALFMKFLKFGAVGLSGVFDT